MKDFILILAIVTSVSIGIMVSGQVVVKKNKTTAISDTTKEYMARRSKQAFHRDSLDVLLDSMYYYNLKSSQEVEKSKKDLIRLRQQQERIKEQIKTVKTN